MKLAWHIAKKDLRRMGVPVGAWLALILVPTIAFRVVSFRVEGHAGSQIDMWMTVLSIWTRLFQAVHLVIGYVLVGSLVLEDSLVGTTNFWTTRPIANARLFAAKIIAAIVLFVVAPVVVLAPVWVSAGFGVGDIVQAAWDFTARFGVATLLALMAASLARNLAQFLFFTVLMVGAFAAMMMISAPFWRDASMAVHESRVQLVLVAALPTVAVVLAHQFLTRRSARTWALVGTAFAGGVVIRNAWPWEIRRAAEYRPAAPRPDDRVAEIAAAPAFTKHSPNSVLSLYGRTAWHPDRFLAPVYARSLDGTMVMRTSYTWQREAGLHALGFDDSAAPVRWQLHMLGGQPLPGNDGQLEFNGLLDVWSVRTRVLGEMPLRPGAEMTHDAMRVRILRFVINEGRLDNIFIEERDSRAHHAVDWSSNWSRRESGRERYIDRYFVVDRAINKATAAASGEIGSVESNSLVLRFRNLGLSWPRDPQGAVLVKVRFERDHSFAVPLQVRGVSSRGFEQIP